MKLKKIIPLVLAVTFYSTIVHAERVWEDMHIKLSNGDVIWATVDRDADCYNLLVGTPMGSNTRIHGNASNCSRDINGYWSTHACSAGSETVNGGIGDVITNIVRRCQ